MKAKFHPSSSSKWLRLLTIYVLSFNYAIRGAYASNYLKGCPASCNMTQDYFPEKAAISSAKHFQVSYHKYYKTIQVSSKYSGNQTIVAYQCGCSPPSQANFPKSTFFVSVPVSRVAITGSPQAPFLEILGVRTSIKALGTSIAYFSSPCLLEMWNEGLIKNAYDSAAYSTDSTLLEAAKVNITFADEYTIPVYNHVLTAEYAETSSAALTEWILYYSLYFNLEGAATQTLHGLNNTVTCQKHNEKLYVPSTGSPKVLIAASYYKGQFSMGSCPNNWYCDMITSAGGTPMQTGSSLNINQWITAAQAANIIWLQGNFTALYSKYHKWENFTSIPAIKNKKVYDILGGGYDDWFGLRYASPGLVYQDFVVMISPCISAGHPFSFFRNALTQPEGPGAISGTCSSISAPLVASFSCTMLSAAQVAQNCPLQTVAHGTGFKTGVHSVMLLLLWLCTFYFLI